jgi:DNA-binding NtrC family response regulator
MEGDLHSLLRAALSEAAGPAVLLDEQLHVVEWAGDVEQLVGAPLERGVLAPKVLCGQGEDRPVAEALAAGSPVSARVYRPGPGGQNRPVLVRASPLRDQGRTLGWLIRMQSVDGSYDEGYGEIVERYGIVSRAGSMKRLLDQVERAARSAVPVLLEGETGSGKSRVAHAIHRASPRAESPFHDVHCGSLPSPLLSSELFGHVQGHFPDAPEAAAGRLRQAEGGTVYLAEVAELPTTLQGELLYLLEHGQVIPTGGRTPEAVNVRLVAGTRQPLSEAVRQGTFREELMYRLRVIPIQVPALRERPGDAELLAWKFIEKSNGASQREITQIEPEAITLLERYHWPGNVRELENVIAHALAMGEGPVLTAQQLPPELRAGPSETRSNAPGASVNRPPAREFEQLPPEARRIWNALERADGHRGRAAASLGMSRVTLWRKMRKHGLAS